jgi:hypothetical protein
VSQLCPWPSKPQALMLSGLHVPLTAKPSEVSSRADRAVGQLYSRNTTIKLLCTHHGLRALHHVLRSLIYTCPGCSSVASHLLKAR